MSPIPPTSPTPKSSITGAIAGSIIGGIDVFSFASLLALILIRRRNKKRKNMVEPSIHLMTTQDLLSPDRSFTGGGVNDNTGHSVQAQDGGLQQQHTEVHNAPVRRLPTLPNRRVYDPNDSSTIHSSFGPPSFVSHYTQPPQYPGDIPSITSLHRDA
ncbi:hypothetical protein BD410DRAFT_294195 [Rickenella mellea]|uniref:Uncharacterized protein n=1 Tax=Rickenella mellea TaxID=50990 RepID=A0A4Y7Q2H0_9AGAM|nr:hypothetical protein BD410DRAFT_294195 [Rickenella mellea]